MNMSGDKPPRPEAPPPPDPSDCCGGGCVRCVFDVYDEQMAEWREACARIDSTAADREGADPRTRD